MHDTDKPIGHLAGTGLPFRPLAPGHQWALRLRAQAIEEASAAWQAPLDLAPLASSSRDGRHALKLGPDEWLLIAQTADAADGLAALARSTPLSLVEISDRELAWELSGDNAAQVLAAGCPLDLADASFPPGRATRTVYGHAEIVLWRPGAERAWQVRALRSFASYLTRHLAHAGRQCESKRTHQ
ncbi:sarcosine oxidase subunit gamma [Rhizorhabdus dicambivorans]|uniref:Sarcosine oxidase subunit gamma n=1 Tax=Rhizorhabdus dicambivorans TaxID=1850238 RepID=A0A2A4FXT2_9SPHN|nr:sarcosine oxidase subunit gamma family protein [Rhizorhabdus dicambivorans]ATE64219.1 sarcosine oxidase subunit gamma [Rhizorhabdus dicambivorans]PCE42508.1 sarcosine oxidase subunit gamma [Rhizorhabdus dicambivorans]